MLTHEIYENARCRALRYLRRAGIAVTGIEKDCVQVAEYNLNDLELFGLELVEYINTDRCCAKELILFPYQTCPEHRHPAVGGEPGKEETFRCRWGEVYLYVPGERTLAPKARVPSGYEQYLTCGHEIVLLPGEQYTLLPDTPHWFQGGPEGAVVSEFSTKSRDGTDIYTDPRIDAAQTRTMA